MPSLRRLPGWARALGVVVVAGLVAIPLGGWDSAEHGSVPVLEPGQVHEADQFATGVVDAELLPTEPGSSLDPEPGVAYLAVTAWVANRTDVTQPAPYGLLLTTAGGRELGPADSVRLLADGGSSPELSPGLASRLAFVWEVTDDALAAGEAIEVSVVDRTETESPLTSRTTWLSPRVGALVELDLA